MVRNTTSRWCGRVQSIYLARTSTNAVLEISLNCLLAEKPEIERRKDQLLKSAAIRFRNRPGHNNK
jgi:hypothetical protein